MFKAPEPPCLGSGCGDNVSQQLGAEKRALLFNRNSKTPCNSAAYRRLPFNRSSKKGTPIPNSTDLKKCRKAASLEDLSPNRREESMQKSRRRPTQMPSPALAVVQTHTITTANECLKNIPRTTLAAREVCHVLMLNAWRKRRHDVQEHTLTIQQLKSQVENLNIQIIVLRRLLDSEKERVAKAHQAVQEMLEQVTESIQEKNVLKGKKEELEKEISHLEECIGDMQTKNQNVKNDYLTAMTEVKVLETQLGKEREKLVKLRENKKHLLNKIHTNEEFVTTKNVIIEQLQQSCEDMEAKLKSEVEQRKQAEVHNEESKQAIKQLEMKHEKLEADLKTVTDASCQLSLKIQTLESLLENREQQNNALQITIQDQQVEIRALQARHTELQSSWGARALDIAAMFARLPFSILYNMGVIFLPHNN